MGAILVLGAGGMLGHKICQRLTDHEVVGLVRREAGEYQAYQKVFAGVTLVGNVDILNGEQLETTVRDLAPAVVINCIGLVRQLQECEDPYLAVALNALLPHRLARICAAIGARLIHISTDCVFSGSRGSYRESDTADACDLYGRSKALGETTPKEPSALTLRTSFIGRELKSSKHGLLEWLLAQNGGSVDGFTRAIYSGLTSIELADVVRCVIERHGRLSGLYHVASEPISKYDLLKLISRTFDLDVAIRGIDEPVCDRSLKTEAFTKATGYAPPAWTVMVRQMYEDPTPYDTWTAMAESPA